MRLERWFRTLSLKAELIWSYLVILGVGGLATSILGSWIVSSTIMMQARRAVDHDFATARTVYEQRLQSLQLPVEFASSGTTIPRYLAAGDRDALYTYIERIRREGGYDFLGLTDRAGRVVLRISRSHHILDNISSISEVRAALAGNRAAGTEILPPEVLANEDAGLPSRARFRAGGGERSLGMALVVAAPVRGARGEVIGALYGGALLSRDSAIVDHVAGLLFKGDHPGDMDAGSVTIFQENLRISTNLRTEEGGRALGSSAPPEVAEAVLRHGQDWRGRAFVVRTWYIAEYAPIRNYARGVIGMLGVGLVEDTYTTIRNRVILSFFAIATAGFILIIGVTYNMIRNITRPIGEMAAATRRITAGHLDQEVRLDSPGEIALLAEAFNAMVASLRQMKGDLEEWGRTLEEKVKQRTEELGAMQARVAQSERLASISMLAAGVAHEVNNPLGGILSLTALTLEDLAKNDPNRENLEEVIRQTERCRNIVKSLLEFSRQSKSHAEPVDLDEILQDTLALISRQAQFFNVTIVRDGEPQLPAVMADEAQLQQVFVNLLMNAVQAMEERGTITIATRHDRAAHTVETTISDTGHGIPEEQIGRIFDPFFTTKGSGQGTGLGLSIAYGIITSHRGTISAKSAPGKGTIFTIRMPVAEVHA